MIDLDAIQARCDAATPGPWVIDGTQYLWHLGTGAIAAKAVDNAHANAAFIANARTDLPALLAAYRQLQAENERLKHEIDTCTESCVYANGEHALVEAQQDDIDKKAMTINLMTAEIDALQEVNRWIPVTERLPEDMQRCLCLVQWNKQDIFGIFTFFSRSVDERTGKAVKNRFWDFDSDVGWYTRNDVSFWRPHPAPPDAKE